MSKAPLAIALIARNAGKTLGACLDSIVPYAEQVLVCVDETTTDDTVQVAREHGAEVHEGLVVSEPHECPKHGKVMAQHFAKARQRSFDLLRKDLPWHGWIDADDIVQGGDKLAEVLARCGDVIGGVWLPYHYSRVGVDGPTATLFDRERIVRHSIGWAWQHRVHEILAPIGRPTESINWTRTDNVAIYHQGEGHDTEGSAKRNILLLEIDLEENPKDARAIFYMGNQYFALSEWQAAIYWYEQALEAENVYQRWQTAIYLSMAYERVGDLVKCKEFAHFALDIAPYHPEPYLRLAVAAMLMGDAQRCEFWTHLADSMAPAPFFAFKNPLDLSYNARVTLGQAYGANGQISRARAELEKAASVIPSPVVLEGIADFRQKEKEASLASAYTHVLAGLPDAARVEFAVPPDVWKFGRVRDTVVPVLLARRNGAQPRAIFYCGRSLEPWGPPSIDSTGIGGSETAVIQIAKRFAADGWRVDVYNEPDKYEGEYEGVGYWGLNRLRAGERADLLVSWRNPQAHSLPIDRRVSVLWQHDLNQGPSAGVDMAKWDKILAVSQWHADYLSNVYGLANTGFAPNGIDLDRFANPVKRVPWRCVYASSPDRGLGNLLRMWKTISAGEPGAELHIAYGWESFDKSIALGAQRLIPIKQDILTLLESTPQVKWRGRLPQDELAKLYQESYAWLYPTPFLEVSCISAMESLAGGCVPIVSTAGALPETVGDAGLLVPGNTYTQAWKEFYCACVRSILMTPGIRMPLSAKGKERAKELTWTHSYSEHWRPLVAGLLEGRKEMVTA